MPVPAVVGTATIGIELRFEFVNKSSISAWGFDRSTPAALDASIGEPPPIPIIKSICLSSPKALILLTVAVDGFSSTASKIWYSILFSFKEFKTWFKEPLALEECLPVTTKAVLP